MRRILIISSLAILGLLIVTTLIISGNVDKFRPRIQAELQKKLNRPVTLGHLGLSLFPPSVKVDSLSIGEDPAFSASQPFAQAQQVFVSVGLFSLIGGNPEVKSLVLEHPKIELIKNSKGKWNFSTLGTNNRQTSGSSDQFSLDEFKITDGQVGLTDQFAGEPRAVYNGIDLNVTGYGPGKRFGLDLGLNLPGQGQQELGFKGKVGPIEPQNTAATPVNGHIKAKEVSITALNRFSPGLLPPNTDGTLTADADVSTEKQVVTVKGDIKITNSEIRGNKLSFPVAAQFDMSANRANDQIQIRSGAFSLGATAFTATGEINAGQKPTALDLHVRTSNSSLVELAKVSGALGLAFNPAYQIKGTVSADITATGTLAAPQLKGTLDARNLDVSGGEIKEPVKVSAISLALSPEVIQAQPFTASSGSTSLQIACSLAHYTAANSTVDATVSTSNANVAELLNMAKAYGFTGSNGASATGRLSLNVRVQGPTKEASHLAFSGTGSISGATLTTPALTKPVSITSASMQFAQNAASITSLNATVGSTTVRGNVSAKNFSAPQINFALTADNIDTNELQALTSTAPSKPSSGGKQSPSLVNQITGSGTLAAARIKADNILLSNVHASCKLDRGVIQLSPLTADVFGGKQDGSLSLDMRPTRPLCSVRSKLSGVDSNALLSAVSSLRDTLYGSLGATTSLAFTLGPSAELARTLNGTLDFQVTNGQLKNVNILNEVAKIGKFLNSSPAQAGSGTALRKLAGTLTIKDGVASTSNLNAAMDAGSLAANGQLSLVDQGLNMHVNAVLGNQVSQSVGGTGIGGFLNTALSNSKGELVIPVNVTGTTAHPVFTPDLQALSKMKLSNLLPTSGDPSKLTSGIVGAIAGKKGVGGAINQVLGGGQPAKSGDKGNQDQNPLNSIFKQLGKKKPQQ